MEKVRCVGAACVLVAILLSMRQWMGGGVFQLALGLSSLWFVIAFVLLTRPPNISEEQLRTGYFELQHEPHRRKVPQMPVSSRLWLSLSAANALCLLLWVSLMVFRR